MDKANHNRLRVGLQWLGVLSHNLQAQIRTYHTRMNADVTISMISSRITLFWHISGSSGHVYHRNQRRHIAARQTSQRGHVLGSVHVYLRLLYCACVLSHQSYDTILPCIISNTNRKQFNAESCTQLSHLRNYRSISRLCQTLTQVKRIISQQQRPLILTMRNYYTRDVERKLSAVHMISLKYREKFLLITKMRAFMLMKHFSVR